DEGLRRQPEVGDVVAALARFGLPDLHQEFPVLGELQDHVVAERLGPAGLALVLLPVLPSRRLPASGRRLSASTRRSRRAAPVAADPYVAAVVDGDAVIRVGPVVAVAGSAPMPDQIARGVELEDGPRWSAAL